MADLRRITLMLTIWTLIACASRSAHQRETVAPPPHTVGQTGAVVGAGAVAGALAPTRFAWAE